MTGRIDLLLGDTGELEILDFKTKQRPTDGDPVLREIYLQLCVYSHLLTERYHRSATKAYVYWTGQRDRDSALMEFILDEEDIKSSIHYFDSIIDKIRKEEFKVEKPPPSKICMECDFRRYCKSRGVISL